jgi:hypothetical protein
MTIISLDFYLNKQLFSFTYWKIKEREREKKDTIYIQNLITPLRNHSARALKNRNSNVMFPMSAHAGKFICCVHKRLRKYP